MYFKLSSGEGTSPFAYTTRAGPPPASSEPTPLQRCCERSLTDIPRFDRTELYCGSAERHDGPILRRNYTVRFVSAISVIPAFYIIQSLTLVLIFLSDHLYSSFCSLPNSHGLLLYYFNPPFPLLRQIGYVAIFTGPNKLAVSSRFSPVASFLLFVLAPLAVPLAKILDWALHDNDADDTNGMHRYDRKELSALVRIQFEERMLAKQARKLDRRRKKVDSPIRISIREADVGNLAAHLRRECEERDGQGERQKLRVSDNAMRFDEVNMVQGALALKDCLVSDVMTPLRRVFALPSDLVLTMDQIVDIHRMGYSRLPVYIVKGSSSNHDESKGNFIGVFRTRHLMVHDSDESRPLSTMPLHKPHCVSPSINMLECIQLLQNGLTSSLSCSAGGHLAFVCQQPSVARDALARGKSIEESGVVGIVTLEDCLEELINSEIFDENDKAENTEYKRGQWAISKWKTFVRDKKEKKNSAYPGGNKYSGGYSSIETSDPIRVGKVTDCVPNMV